ncbi:Uncharacterised protein [Sphingobacterium multivorum]|uniref:Uncharacterized protein n=1 Tax=Sphingobacterium multivorum TaxID=28454 RepID=A0A2X2JKH5_SPHMU|nr:Uncharacterised protein [Sphingobacterium multivorum]
MNSILSAIHWNIDPEMFNFGAFALRYYALCLVVSIFCFIRDHVAYIQKGRPHTGTVGSAFNLYFSGHFDRSTIRTLPILRF